MKTSLLRSLLLLPLLAATAAHAAYVRPVPTAASLTLNGVAYSAGMKISATKNTAGNYEVRIKQSGFNTKGWGVDGDSTGAPANTYAVDAGTSGTACTSKSVADMPSAGPYAGVAGYTPPVTTAAPFAESRCNALYRATRDTSLFGITPIYAGNTHIDASGNGDITVEISPTVAREPFVMTWQT